MNAGRAPVREQRLGGVDVHAGVEVRTDRQERRPVGQERLAQPGVDVVLEEDLAAGDHQQLGGQAQRLLGPRRQQDLPRVAVDAPLPHELDDRHPERLVRLAVLERRCVAGQDLPERFGIGRAGHELRGGEPPGEREQPRPRREERELAQSRTGEREGAAAAPVVFGGRSTAMTAMHLQ